MKTSINFDLNVSTKIFGLKLKTLSKGLNEIAENLEYIDKNYCPQCGEKIEEGICKQCGYVNIREYINYQQEETNEG